MIHLPFQAVNHGSHQPKTQESHFQSDALVITGCKDQALSASYSPNNRYTFNNVSKALAQPCHPIWAEHRHKIDEARLLYVKPGTSHPRCQSDRIERLLFVLNMVLGDAL